MSRLSARNPWSFQHGLVACLLAGLVLAGPASGLLSARDAAWWLLHAALVAIVFLKIAVIVAGFVSGGASPVPALQDDELPSYTVLVPLYREPEVVGQLVTAMSQLDYPRNKLEVLLLLEEDDNATRNALSAMSRQLVTGVRAVTVPDQGPQTKPRACNYGLSIATGSCVVVYDAEDKPEPDQLRKAAAVFATADKAVACLQAKLNYFNHSHNIITRLFALEYTTWFDVYLPGLHALRAPIPLGGTSNHFRKRVLEELGGWDAYNVTEDCDLGIRLARAGWETQILHSTTWEEACSRVRPWLAQRSRWVKGYLQTFLVHTKSLPALVKDLGLYRCLLMGLTVGGLVLSLLLALPALGLIVAWLVAYFGDPFWRADRMVWAISVSLLAFVGYFVGAHMLAAQRRKRHGLIPYALLLPGYWLLMSLGAWRGFIQFFFKPFHWEKTPHGLTLPAQETESLSEPHARAPDTFPALAVDRSSNERSTSEAAADDHPNRRSLLLGFGAAAVAISLSLLPYYVLQVKPLTNTEVVVPFDKEWTRSTGLKLLVRIASVVLAEVEAVHDSVVVFLKVGDGEWFEKAVNVGHRGGSIGQELSISASFDDGWKPVGHGRPWGPWCLRRVREVGVRAYGERSSLPSLELVSTEAAGSAPVPKPEYLVEQSIPDAATTQLVHEVQFFLSREYSNPFDAAQVEVWGVFHGPSGEKTVVPAFYASDYQRKAPTGDELIPEGRPYWALRYRPKVAGKHSWYIEGRDSKGSLGRSKQFEFSAVAAAGMRGVKVAKGGDYFALDDSSFFYPIGINLRSPSDGGARNYDFKAPENSDGLPVMLDYVARMKAAKISLGRVWLTPWFGGLEWSRNVDGYHGVGEYNLQNAWRLDRLLEAAAAAQIYLEFLLFPHGPYQPEEMEPWGQLLDSQFKDSPYNAKNGGPVVEPADFFSNEAARKATRNYLRYVAARYGSSPALFGWTLWNEVDTVSIDIPRIASWHKEMAAYLRKQDPADHILSTEFRLSGHESIWSLPEIDYTQSEAYDHHAKDGLVSRMTDRIAKLEEYGKLKVLEEYGGAWWGASMDLLAQNIHDGLWIGWNKGLPSTPLAWWWNFIFEKGVDRYYKVFATFVDGEDLRRRPWLRKEPKVHDAGELRALSNQSHDVAFAWIYSPSATERVEPMPKSVEALFAKDTDTAPTQASAKPLAAGYRDGNPELFKAIEGARLELTDLDDGTYRYEVWDTWSVRPPVVGSTQVTGGRVKIPLPTLVRDVAIKLYGTDWRRHD